MALKEYLQDIDGLSENEKQSMIERCEELQGDGMSEKEAYKVVIEEMQEDIDTDQRSLNEQIGVESQSPEDRKAGRENVRQGEIDELHTGYRKEMLGIESGEGKNTTPKKD